MSGSCYLCKIVKAELVFPNLETDLLRSPEVHECAVIGLASEAWGQKVAAIVVLSEEEKSSRESRKGKTWSAMDMRRALRERLAAYKIPQEMKVLDAIPRNAMGKGKVATYNHR